MMSLKSILFPKELQQKPFISYAKQIKKNLKCGFVGETQ